jgi:hypothetical protein
MSDLERWQRVAPTRNVPEVSLHPGCEPQESPSPSGPDSTASMISPVSPSRSRASSTNSRLTPSFRIGHVSPSRALHHRVEDIIHEFLGSPTDLFRHGFQRFPRRGSRRLKTGIDRRRWTDRSNEPVAPGESFRGRRDCKFIEPPLSAYLFMVGTVPSWGVHLGFDSHHFPHLDPPLSRDRAGAPRDTPACGIYARSSRSTRSRRARS